LKALGCRVTWLEAIDPRTPAEEIRTLAASLRGRLERYGLAGCVALCSVTAEPLPPGAGAAGGELDVDLLLNLQYGLSADVVRRFRRSVLIDIDPGLLQIWMYEGQIEVTRHDVYFTIGETVGQPGSGIPNMGLAWQYTPPCVALDWWPTCRAPVGAPFTTVAHWYDADDWVSHDGECYANGKRSGFLPFLELPRRTAHPLELAADIVADDEDQALLRGHGWRVRESVAVSSTPWDYQRYIQDSRGEFSCVKPSCVKLANAWISDRSLCYLASGKPVVVQHTGPSRFLPDAAGLFRFRDLAEAARHLDAVAADYEHQCRLARALAEEFFDARKVVKRVLERALT
jgi:hypothetical protein